MSRVAPQVEHVQTPLGTSSSHASLTTLSSVWASWSTTCFSMGTFVVNDECPVWAWCSEAFPVTTAWHVLHTVSSSMTDLYVAGTSTCSVSASWCTVSTPSTHWWAWSPTRVEAPFAGCDEPPPACSVPPETAPLTATGPPSA